jgi:hypothetical protein
MTRESPLRNGQPLVSNQLLETNRAKRSYTNHWQRPAFAAALIFRLSGGIGRVGANDKNELTASMSVGFVAVASLLNNSEMAAQTHGALVGLVQQFFEYVVA